jgi:ribosomal protein L11 methyltransferase
MSKSGSIKLSIDLPAGQHETMMAVLSTVGYYAFEEQSDCLDAYISETDFDENGLKQTVSNFFPELELVSKTELIPAKDWNAQWEKDFEPVRVNDFCLVRAPFKPSEENFAQEVVVFPKMAFGTGHHATTWLMIEQCGEMDFKGKKVLDMGCGTGVLGILALKLGASEVTAVDIDEWSYENALENAQLNGTEELVVIQGDSSAIPKACYEIILANINRNVLLADRDKLFSHLEAGGMLVLSGIYDFDEHILTSHYLEEGSDSPQLELLSRKARNEWVRLVFRKNDNLQ